MKNFYLTLAAMIFVSMTSVAAEIVKYPGILKIAVNGHFHPLTYFQNGKLTGIDVDLAQEVCKRAELKCDFDVIPDWSQLTTGVGLSNGYDVVSAIFNLEPRREHSLFSQPMYSLLQQIGFNQQAYESRFKAVIESEISQGEAVELSRNLIILFNETGPKLKVSAVSGTAHFSLFSQRYGDIIELRSVDSIAKVLEDLSHGRADLSITDAATFLAEEHHGIKVVKTSINEPQFIGPMAMAFPKTTEGRERKALFDRKLSEMQSDGTVCAILRRHIEADLALTIEMPSCR